MNFKDGDYYLQLDTNGELTIWLRQHMRWSILPYKDGTIVDRDINEVFKYGMQNIDQVLISDGKEILRKRSTKHDYEF